MTMYRLTTITKNASPIPEIKDILESHEAKILEQTEHGERRFAYPIQKLDRGNYTSFLVEMNPSGAELVEKTVRELEGVMRTLLVEWPSAKAMKSKIHKIESETAKVAKPIKPAQEVIKKTLSKDKKVVKSKKAKKTAESDSDTERLKELDEKLAEILKS